MTGLDFILVAIAIAVGCGAAVLVQDVINRRAISKITGAVPFLAFRCWKYGEADAAEQFIGAFETIDDALREAVQGADDDDSCMVFDVQNREWIYTGTGRKRT